MTIWPASIRTGLLCGTILAPSIPRRPMANSAGASIRLTIFTRTVLSTRASSTIVNGCPSPRITDTSAIPVFTSTSVNSPNTAAISAGYSTTRGRSSDSFCPSIAACDE